MTVAALQQGEVIPRDQPFAAPMSRHGHARSKAKGEQLYGMQSDDPRGAPAQTPSPVKLLLTFRVQGDGRIVWTTAMDTLVRAQERGCQGCGDTVDLFPFSMAFQPIVDIQEQRIDAYEALVRGPSGEGAMEILGKVNDTNRYAFDQSCRTKAIGLAGRLGMTARLNINFLPNAVYEPKACIRATLAAASRTGFPLRNLTFEFVENEEIADQQHTLRIIDEYRRHGFQIALDDFGTGYSGLSRLAQLQPDIVKLDRELVQHCDRSKIRLAIIASIVALGQETGIKVVVEGVERAEEADALRSVGARFVQGFLYARPMFEGLVTEQQIDWP